MVFDLTPTQRDYVFSDAVVNVIYSNTGEGKTYASIAAMIVHAKRCGRPIHAAIVRDTHENIKTSTARSILETFQEHPGMIQFRNDFKQLTIFSKPRVDVDLFGIDNLGSLSKLQGPEYALIWLEEPAPMADKVNAGLAVEVYRAALVRCARQKGAKARLQVSMNPADQEHWTYDELIEKGPIPDPGNPLITKAVFRVNPGENPHVSETSRQAVRVAYQSDPASYCRYVLGQFAPVYKGAKVTPEYNPAIHLAPYPLTPAPGLVSFRLWDGWHNPSCLLGQITSIGRTVIIDTLRMANTDVETLINVKVKPLLESPKWRNKARAWRDIGDVSMRQPDQSNIARSAARVIEEAFGTSFEPGPKQWPHLRDGLKRGLQMMIQGLPAVTINPEERLLHKALSGGWHYKTDNNGNIIGQIPDKDEHSHIGDPFANGMSVLFPAQDYRKGLDRYKAQLAAASKRVSSYIH